MIRRSNTHKVGAHFIHDPSIRIVFGYNGLAVDHALDHVWQSFWPMPPFVDDVEEARKAGAYGYSDHWHEMQERE